VRSKTLAGPLRLAAGAAMAAGALAETSAHASGHGAQNTPARLGFRLPAEWEAHEATWLAWPHNLTDWPGKFAPVPWVYGEIVRKIAPGELVRILVNSKAHEAQARRVLARVGVGLSRIEFFRFPTNRGWTRDFGPIFIRREQPHPEVAIVQFRFNAWAKYPNWQKDNRVSALAARALRCPVFRASANGRDFVLEGGSIEVNGCGTLLTTEECLLDLTTQARNPDLSRAAVEETLRAFL
jgi:agmatine deiminase